LPLRPAELEVARTSGVPWRVPVDEVAGREWSVQRADVGIGPVDPTDRVRCGRAVDVRAATGNAAAAFRERSKVAPKMELR
jgi:hypothetical protein